MSKPFFNQNFLPEPQKINIKRVYKIIDAAVKKRIMMQLKFKHLEPETWIKGLVNF